MKQFKFMIAIMISLLSGALCAQIAPPKQFNVGVFAYEGVEILDFSGPAEVFGSTAGFNTFVVGLTKDPVKSQGFITVTPQYGLDDCPPTDILIFPGGGSGRLLGNADFIAWVQKRAEKTMFMMSVCTGAHILGKAGLLDGKEATTWHGAIESLQNQNPDTKVLTQTRFVDNGHVITTAGVSAGIDGALHMVARLKGMTTAASTAHYMEYDKWNPQAGKIIETDFVKSIRQAGFKKALKMHEATMPAGFPLFYEGEMLNLVSELKATQPAEAETILQYMLKTQPGDGICDALGDLWRKQGKKAPLSSVEFKSKINAGHIDEAVEAYSVVQKDYPGWILFEEDWMNKTGYYFLRQGKNKEAVQLFLMNATTHSNSANAFDSLADGYEAAGDVKQALQTGETCLKVLAAENVSDEQRAQLIKATNDRVTRLKKQD